jgi:pimeloyl-ACP methyl ester carboxylesterase
MEKFIMADGVAVRVSDTGMPGGSSEMPGASDVSGVGSRTVVLLHGYLENLNVWDEVMGLLQPHVRVVAIDLPGHGISEVRGPVHSMEFLAGVVRGACSTLGVGKFTVVGHSMGGYVALALAEAHPELLDGLVLLSSTPNADPEEKRADRQREIAIVEGGKKELLSRTQPGRGFAPQNRKRMADEIEDLAELVMLTEDDGITALLRGMALRPDRGEVMRALRAPELLILGRHDEYITPEVASKMIAAQPQARVVWLEESGHNGMIEQPRIVAETILEFIQNQR